MPSENKRSTPQSGRMDEFTGPNLAYILELYDRYRADPNSVDEAARKLFEGWSPLEAAVPVRVPGTGDLLSLTGAANLAQAIRVYGYLVANLNPLEKPPAQTNIPILTPEFHQVKEEDLRDLPADVANLTDGGSRANAQEAVEVLRSIYCGTIGYDYGHIRIPEERAWLFQAAETGRFRPPAQPVDGNKLLDCLT